MGLCGDAGGGDGGGEAGSAGGCKARRGEPSERLIAAALATTRDISQAVETVLGADVTQQMRIALEQTADRRDVVCGLMRTRVCAAIKSGVASGFHESVTPLVSQLVAKVNKLIRLNRAVHAPTYDRILRGEIAGA